MKSKITERSIPHKRGRKQMMKTKRLGHKRTRRMPLESGPEEIEMERHRAELNTENPKNILFPPKN